MTSRTWRVHIDVAETQYRALLHAATALDMEAQDDESVEMRRHVESLERLRVKLAPPEHF